MTRSHRFVLLVLFAIASVASVGLYLRSLAVRRTEASDWIAAGRPVPPYLLFVSTRSDESFGRVGYVPLPAAEGPRYLTPLSCVRMHYSAGSGLCVGLSESYGAQPYASIFDSDFKTSPRLPLTGPPSRVRVSRDGRFGAVTVFETGHSYADAGFSTRTSVLDLTSRTIVDDLEKYTVFDQGAILRRPDFNFWGMTFEPGGDQFFASVSSLGKISLVRGGVTKHSVEVIRDGVECPSLSPDGTKLIFKRRQSSRSAVTWRLAVLELASMREWLVESESRSVDDQVEWLDDQRVLYQMATGAGANMWVANISSSEPATLFLSGAMSPAVVR